MKQRNCFERLGESILEYSRLFRELFASFLIFDEAYQSISTETTSCYYEGREKRETCLDSMYTCFHEEVGI